MIEKTEAATTALNRVANLMLETGKQLIGALSIYRDAAAAHGKLIARRAAGLEVTAPEWEPAEAALLLSAREIRRLKAIGNLQARILETVAAAACEVADVEVQ